MTQEGKFGVHEAVCLLTITSVAKVFYTSPALLVGIVGTANWYMTLISAATAAFGFTFIYFLLKRFPGKNIMEIYDSVLGSFLGFIFSFMLLFIIVATGISNLREFSDVLKVYVYPDSPLGYLMGIVLFTAVILSFLGLETIARYSKFVGYALLFGFVLVMILSIQNYEFFRIFPLLGHGLGTTVYNGLIRSSGHAEIIIIAIFAGSLQGISHIKKAAYTSFVLAGIIVSFSFLSFIMSFPYTVAQELTAPMYEMVGVINYGSFFQRVEPIFLFVWSISSLISITVLFYMALLIYCHMFRINDKKPLIIPFSIIFFALASIPLSIIHLIKGLIQTLRSFSWIFFFIPPIVTLIAAKIFKKKGSPNA